jgi:hypothetical protein
MYQLISNRLHRPVTKRSDEQNDTYFIAQSFDEL